MSLQQEIKEMGLKAQEAARNLVTLSTAQKNKILSAMADEIEKRCDMILSANAADIKNAVAGGLAPQMIDRLTLNEKRLKDMAKAIREVVALKDPVGRTLRKTLRPNGLIIKKVSVPIGVIVIIYEARPNVTSDAAILCLKASNAVILRGGKEAMQSNIAIAEAMMAGGSREGLPENAIQIVKTTEREAIKELVQLEGIVDLVMPRGGEALIKAVAQEALVPVIKHYKGICHVFVDESADEEMAKKIVLNAKCQRPSVCNAMETLLVHKKIATTFLPKAAEALKAKGVELRGCEETRKILPDIKAATEEDWYTEYLALVLSIRVVRNLSEAIAHINHYGSHHSDAIITSSKSAAKRFCTEVDSAAVYVNASTRFTDGGEFGMGAEIGISTDKLHARGPMGLEELTSYKYVVYGTGQVRE